MEEELNSAKIFKEDLYKQLARIGKCLSSDKRLEILNVLSNGSRTVEKIAAYTDMNIANVSRHLQVLLDAKLVKFSKKGTYVIYSWPIQKSSNFFPLYGELVKNRFLTLAD